VVGAHVTEIWLTYTVSDKIPPNRQPAMPRGSSTPHCTNLYARIVAVEPAQVAQCGLCTVCQRKKYRDVTGMVRGHTPRLDLDAARLQELDGVAFQLVVVDHAHQFVQINAVRDLVLCRSNARIRKNARQR